MKNMCTLVYSCSNQRGATLPPNSSQPQLSARAKAEEDETIFQVRLRKKIKLGYTADSIYHTVHTIDTAGRAREKTTLFSHK